MANIFAQMKEYVEKHKRNTFDLSFSNNLTFNFGQLVPVFCKEVIPGDSFKINPAFGLRLMPMVFPVQTRLNANLHFFYVRNRNLWKDWPDFIGRTKSGLVSPYLSEVDWIKTGSLADYLGCPTTLVGDYGNTQVNTTGSALIGNIQGNGVYKALMYGASGTVTSYNSQPYLGIYSSASGSTLLGLNSIASRSQGLVSYLDDHGEFQYVATGSCRMCISRIFDFGALPEGNLKNSLNCLINQANFSIDWFRVYLFVNNGSDWIPRFCLYAGDRPVPGQGPWGFTRNNIVSRSVGDNMSSITFDQDRDSLYVCDLLNRSLYPTVYYTYQEFLSVLDSLGSRNVRIAFATERIYTPGEQEDPDLSSKSIGSAEGKQLAVGQFSTGQIQGIAIKQTVGQGIRDISEVGALDPYYGGQLHISSLPFRAYESIYNAFYRNQFNDPFILDGQKEYNKFIRTNDGGEDCNKYPIYNRNYELDFLTSAKQSPVDGDMTPLVGVNASGKFTFKNQDGTTYTVTPQIGEDGHTLTGIESMEGEPENNSGLRRLVDAISLGISINDFRNVNALQRWLETNLRRGYRYRDQVLSHFGVDISYEELDMPEFIGGMSNPVLVNKIDQHTDQTGNPDGLGDFAKVLGSFAGQGQVFAQAKHSITKYCDEHGFIIGILSVTPTPSYSQLLPKFFIKDNVLDYFFPEFGHIGNQPITYKEVCPLQTFAAGDNFTDVFGYQRAWYDYVSSVDELHGNFRNSLDGFVITRMFDTKPELGKDFIECRSDTMSNPFSVTDETDKIVGQVYFDVSAQRPIPKFGIPRLE